MDLRTRVLSALAWAVSISGITQLINWGITLYVIRLLTPTDYGTMALAMGFIVVLLPIGQLGLGSAVIRQKHLNALLLRKVFGLVLTISGLAAAFLFASADAIASFFSDKRLTSVLQILSISLVLMAFSVVPRALLTRELDFRRQSFVDMAGALIGGLLTLQLARSGYGVWALIIGHLTMLTIQSVGLMWMARFITVPSFSFTGIREVAVFGSWITAEQLIWYLRGQLDIMIIGRLLGLQTVGAYSVAKHLATLPHAKVQRIINSIAFPAYGKAQTSGVDPTYYLLKYLRLSSVLSFPVYFGISAIAPEFVIVFLTEKWSSTVVPMQIIAMMGPMVAAIAAVSPFLQALGHVRTSFENQLIGTAGLIVSIAIGAQWGLLGVSIGWACGYFATSIIIWNRSCAITSLRRGDVFNTLVKASVPALIMYGAVILCSHLFPYQLPILAKLIILIFVGICVYSIAAWTIAKTEVLELLDLLPGSR
jgi:O-antigen/teichoic acid export membrane protein